VVLPLYARLSASDRQRVFQRLPQRRVVLATNVAETSLTIPGIVYVVDTGVARVNRYSVRTGVSQLLVEPSAFLGRMSPRDSHAAAIPSSTPPPRIPLTHAAVDGPSKHAAVDVHQRRHDAGCDSQRP
jgi:hypothetical protein